MDKLLGFLPDVDPTVAGVITQCSNMIPYEYGMKGAPSGVTPSVVPVLPAECRNASVVEKLDGTRRVIASTPTKLYELVAGAWVDVSRVGNYSAGVENRYSMAQFGDAIIIANDAEKLQRSTSGAFADIASAPIAKIVFSVGGFVMALNTGDATYGTSPDRWWCSASFVDTDWTPNVATLCTTGRLVSTPGEITAGGRLGEYAVAYKAKGIYLGQFVGAPAVWDWLQVPGEAGCVGQDAWCDIGGAHFFIGNENLYLFDGSRPTVIGTGEVRQWFYNESNPKYRYKTQCVFDRQNGAVWTFFCSVSSSTPDRALVYHVVSKQWGLVDLPIEAAMNYISPGGTIDGLVDYSATINGLSAYAIDSQFWLQEGRVMAIFNKAHQLQSMTGPTLTSGFTTGDAGDDDRVTLLSKIRLRFAPGFAPLTANAETFSKMTEGDNLALRNTGAMNDGKFDVLQSGRWHRATFSFTGNVRVLALGATLKPQGSR